MRVKSFFSPFIYYIFICIYIFILKISISGHPNIMIKKLIDFSVFLLLISLIHFSFIYFWSIHVSFASPTFFFFYIVFAYPFRKLSLSIFLFFHFSHFHSLSFLSFLFLIFIFSVINSFMRWTFPLTRLVLRWREGGQGRERG